MRHFTVHISVVSPESHIHPFTTSRQPVAVVGFTLYLLSYGRRESCCDEFDSEWVGDTSSRPVGVLVA